MNTLKIVKTALLRQLAAIKTAELDGSKLGLYTNDFTPNANTVIGDFTVATFTGYAQVTITLFDAAYIDENANAAIIGGLVQFAPASPYTVGESVYGWYLTTSTGALISGGRFPNAPVPMGVAGNYVQVVPGEVFAQN